MPIMSCIDVEVADEAGIMLLRDVMSANVVSIPSTAPATEARAIMEAHRIRHLPVVDEGELVGLVSRDSLARVGPSKLANCGTHEANYLSGNLTVAEVMRRDVVTLPPTATVEEAAALARLRGVGSVLVVEKEHLVGIATSADFFDKVANPILGIDQPGIRLTIRDCCRNPFDLLKVMALISRFDANIISVCTVTQPEKGRQHLIVHIDSKDSAEIVDALRSGGYRVEERAR